MSLRYWIKKAYERIDDWYELWIYNFIHYKRICRNVALAVADCRAGRVYDMEGNLIDTNIRKRENNQKQEQGF